MNRTLSNINSKVWFIFAPELDRLKMDAPQMESVLKSFDGKFQQAAKPQSLAGFAAQPIDKTSYAFGIGSVAVVNISDVLYFSGGMLDDYIADLFGGTSTRKLMDDLQQIKTDRTIQSVILNINSGGGEAFGINELANQIRALNKVKPVIAYISGYGASAAYFLAANAGRVVCDEQAMLGSIGVVAQWMDYKEFYASMGIIYEEVTSDGAPYKRLDPRNEEHRQIFKDQLNGMEKVFHKSVAKGRNVPVETVRNNFGKGSIMAGWQCVPLGMADAVGSLEQVITELNKSSANSNKSPKAQLRGEKQMSLAQKLKEFFASDEIKPLLGDENLMEAEQENETATLLAAAKAENARLTAERQSLIDNQAATAKTNAIAEVKVKTETFVAAELTANRLTPGEKDSFAAAYAQALTDDVNAPLANGSRAAQLEAAQSKRTPHLFTKEAVGADATMKVLHGEETTGVSEERKTELLNKTTLGRTVLKAVK